MRKISIKDGQKVRLYPDVIAQKWSNPGVSNMKPTSQMQPACSSVTRDLRQGGNLPE